MPYIYVFASYWLRKPWQLVALIIGLSIATAMWTGVQAINNEAKASYDTAASLLTDGQYDQLVPKRGQSIAQKTYIALRRAGWLVSPLIEGEILDYEYKGQLVRFCCKGCRKDFVKNPELYLEKLEKLKTLKQVLNETQKKGCGLNVLNVVK